MCGRYEISPFIKDKINGYSFVIDVKEKGEAFPGDNVVVICLNRKEKISYFDMKWGYGLNNNKLVFNARSENVKDKVLFKDDYRLHHCLVETNAYYEWDKDKVKYAIGENEVFYLCGIYRFNKNRFEFTILTMASTGKIKDIHDRMPVCIKKEDIKRWLCLKEDPDAILKIAFEPSIIKKT